MMKENGKNGNHEEIDADQLIRNYEESGPVDAVPEEVQADAEWYEQAKQDTRQPPEAVLTGGDIDADWRQASFGGDEAVGGSNPTPDQDNVDGIGKAVGVTYEDAEPLWLEEKIAQRDEERWELNPVSSEDYAERQTVEEGPSPAKAKQKDLKRGPLHLKRHKRN